jgi:biotin carboxylase
VRTALVVCPTPRDLTELADPRIGERFSLLICPVRMGPAFDAAGYLERLARLRPRPDGLLAARDGSAHLASLAAERLGLPGLRHDAFLNCHDKLRSRRLQEAAVPDATPGFGELDPWAPPAPGAEPLPYPFFVKPAAAHLSQLAARVERREELEALLGRARDELDAVTAYDRAVGGRRFDRLLAEEALAGAMVTYEGMVLGGTVTTIGVTDAVLHPNGISFLRFEYPTRLAREAVAAMESVAQRLAPALGLERTLFNMELFVGDDGRPLLVEVNPRLASQFAPLVRALHGVSTYELQLELATGGRPSLPPARPDAVAASFVLRVQGDAAVVRVPDARALAERFPEAHVELLVRPGQRLSANDDDLLSYRLAVVALSARDRSALEARYRELVAALDFQLDPPKSLLDDPAAQD